MDVARAAKFHRVLHLGFKVVQVRNRGGRDVRDLVRHGDGGDELALAEFIAGMRAHRHGGGSARCRRRGGRALHAGIHVRLVVVADVQHIIVALEHAGQATEPDVGGAAVAALCDHPHVVAALYLQRRRDAGCHRCGVAEHRVHPWHLPGRFGIRRGKHFQAAGGIGRDHLRAGRLHRRVQRVARAQRLAASLAGAVSRIDRITAIPLRLDAAVFRFQQAVADGERAGLVELDGLKAHAGSLRDLRCDCADVAQYVFRRRPGAAHVAFARQLFVDHVPFQVEEGQCGKRILFCLAE